MANHETRIQLCGKLVARIDGRRVDANLPGRQGRLAFAYLALNRHRVVTRSALVDAIWPVEPPALVDTAVSALISKLRKALGSDAVSGRGDVRLVLSDAWVDVEAAAEAIHRAEGAVARLAWAEVWGPGRVALHIARREFLPGESADWVEDQGACSRRSSYVRSNASPGRASSSGRTSASRPSARGETSSGWHRIVRAGIASS